MKRFWHFTVLKDEMEKKYLKLKKIIKNFENQSKNSFGISLYIVTMKYKKELSIC